MIERLCLKPEQVHSSFTVIQHENILNPMSVSSTQSINRRVSGVQNVGFIDS